MAREAAGFRTAMGRTEYYANRTDFGLTAPSFAL